MSLAGDTDCSPCPAGTYKNSLGSSACDQCPSLSKSVVSGSQLCKCDEGFERSSDDVKLGCLIRTQSGANADGRDFMVKIALQVGSNSTKNQEQFESHLQLQSAVFFSCPADGVTVTLQSRRSSKLNLDLEAIVKGDPSDITTATHDHFQEFLGTDRRWAVTVLSLTATCGVGFSRANSSYAITSNSSCVPCEQGTFKVSLEDIPCTACPIHSSSNGTGSSECMCESGYRETNTSVSDEQGIQCVSSQYISVEGAAEAAGSVSTAVGVVVAANVAVAVGTSVGVSVSSAVAASSGGAAGGAVGGGSGSAVSGGSSAGGHSSSSTMSLITQVQVRCTLISQSFQRLPPQWIKPVLSPNTLHFLCGGQQTLLC